MHKQRAAPAPALQTPASAGRYVALACTTHTGAPKVSKAWGQDAEAWRQRLTGRRGLAAAPERHSPAAAASVRRGGQAGNRSHRQT